MNARNLPAIGPEDLLVEGAIVLGLHLNPGQVQAFRLYREEIARWSARTNLTALREAAEIVREGFLDSLACLPLVPRGATRLLDIGSGAGFPALPIKLTCTRLHLTMVEASHKKTTFLRHIIRSLSLRDVRVVTGRAEDLAAHPEEQGAYDLAFARAVAPLRQQASLVAPFLRSGGLFLAQVGPRSDPIETVIGRPGQLFEVSGEFVLPAILNRPNRRVIGLQRIGGPLAG